MMTLKCNETQKASMYSVLMLLQRKGSKPEAWVSFLNGELSKCWEDVKHGTAHNRDSLPHKSRSVSEKGIHFYWVIPSCRMPPLCRI